MELVERERIATTRWKIYVSSRGGIYIGRNPAKSTGIKRRGALKERETRGPIYSAAFQIRPRGDYLLRETAPDFGLRGLQYDFICKQDVRDNTKSLERFLKDFSVVKFWKNQRNLNFRETCL